MSIKRSQRIFATPLLLAGLALSSHAYAGTLTIDNFTDVQSVSDRGNSAGANLSVLKELKGTDLKHASRTFTALAEAGGYANKEDIVSSGNSLKISNSANSAGVATVRWDFDAMDFTQYGNAILLEVLAIDLNAKIEMIANGTASSGVKTFGGVGALLVNFSDFSGGAAFKDIHSLSLNFTGAKSWDGQFRILATSTTPALTATVPVPSTFALMGSALLGLMGFTGRKSAVSNS